MRTEIKLDNKYYKVMRLPTQTLANQMANKIGQGTSLYGDLTNWSAWIQDDWQEGVGNLRPAVNGGFLYGEVESRVPHQLIMPQKLTPTDTLDKTTGYKREHYIDGRSTFFTLNQDDRIAIPIQPSSVQATTTRFYVQISIDNYVGGTLKFELHSTSSGGTVEGALISSATLSIQSVTPGYYWYGVKLTTSALVAGTIYWLEVINQTSAGGHVTVSGADPAYSTFTPHSYHKTAAGAWTSLASIIHPYFLTGLENIATTNTQSGNGIFRFNAQLYCYTDKKVFKWDGAKWVSVGTISGISSVTGAVPFIDKVYFGNAAGDLDYATMDVSQIFADAASDGKLFLSYNGYLYRARVNTVEYTVDGTVWEPSTTLGKAIRVSDTSDPITGMCGMGENVYVATTKGLAAIYPGMIARTIIPWGSVDAQNGVRMKNFQGAIYIIVGGRMVRYSEDGSLQDIWMTRDDDFLSNRIGKVIDIEVMNNWLLALVCSGEADKGNPTIWGYQNNKWHHIATLPTSNTTVSGITLDYDMYYDRATSRLWVITMDAMVYWWYISDYSLNPYNDPLSRYVTTAWVEWDWFTGPILEASKDFESVTLLCENVTGSAYLDLYWKDDDSTQWELLGRVTQNIQELRWLMASGTRPDTQRLKLGILLYSKDFISTPRVRAIRVKYHLIVRDWFRWNVIIDVSGRTNAHQMLADGTRFDLTATQAKDAISDLCTRVSPFIYEDVDGHRYEVKVSDGNFQYTKYEYNELTGAVWWEGQWNLVLEQVTNGYAP